MNLLSEITGVSGTVIKIKLLSEIVRAETMVSMKKGCLMVQNRAKENISGEHGHIRHIQTGNLRRNIKSKVGWTSTFELIGIIGTDVPYAPYIESLPDGGFLYPALTEVGKEVVGIVRKDIGDVIKGKFR